MSIIIRKMTTTIEQYAKNTTNCIETISLTNAQKTHSNVSLCAMTPFFIEEEKCCQLQLCLRIFSLSV